MPFKIVRPLSAALVAVITCVFALTSSVYAASPMPQTVIQSDPVYPMPVGYQYLEDSLFRFDFETVAGIADEEWSDSDEGGTTVGFTDSQYWLRTSIVNTTNQLRNVLLEVNYPQLDNVYFKAIKSDGSIIELSSGDMTPFYPRPVDHANSILRFKLAPGESIAAYLRVSSEGTVILPLRLWEEKQFYEATAQSHYLHFFFYGALCVIIAINLAVFFLLREKLYVFYCTAATGYLLFFATSRGYLHQLVLMDYPELNGRLFLISMPLLATFSLLFARQFLRTMKHSPQLDMTLQVMAVFHTLGMAGAIFMAYDMSVRISAIGAIFLFVVLFISGPISWYKGVRAGMFFTVAWIPLTLGFVATAGRSAGFLPNNFWTEYAMQIGSGIELLILTCALADRLYHEREKKIVAQEKSLEVEKQRNSTQRLLTQTMSRDAVTKLSNRNRFEWLISNTIEEDPSSRYFVMVARITRISEIMHTLGLASSERVLRKVAQKMNAIAADFDGVISTKNEEGQVDSVFQLSGETFGVLIRQSSFENAPEQYYAILKHLAQPVEVEGLSLELAPVFGSALYPKHGKEPLQLIRNAHIAMNNSRLSKGKMGIYDKKLDIYSENRLTLMTELREAIDRNGLSLYYQPKFSMKDNQVVGLEALIRWVHPQRGFIPPDEFITLAEETGLINRLTLWAFERAVKDLVLLRSNQYHGSMSINISARDLLSENFGRKLKEILDKYSMPASSIFLELTETAAMEDPLAGIAALNTLSLIGFKISIDDFGAGYSSLSYLQRIPASEIKLDRSLIVDILESESSRVIVKTSIDMVHALGYDLVAEGIESEAVVKILEELNCDRFQGYWCCKPLPLVELNDWMRKQSWQPYFGAKASV